MFPKHPQNYYIKFNFSHLLPTICISTFLIFTSTYAHSAETSPIIVSATRIQSEADRAAENVIIYTEKDIEKLPGRDLGEVLSLIPGVNIAVRNKFGQSTSLTIQGSRSRQVLVMVDGIPFNTQLSGQANPTKIPIENIKQIEVIKGASSSAWGSSLGGVINVITKEVGENTIPTGNFTSSFAEFGTTKNSLDLAGRIGKAGYFVSGSFMNTSGTRSISDVEEQKYFSKLNYPVGDQAKLTASFGYSGAEVRDGVKPSGSTTLQPYYSRYGKMSFEIDKPKFQLNISGKYNNQNIKTETVGGLLTNNSNIYNGLSGVARFTFREKDKLVVGSDFEWQKIKSSRNIPQPKHIHMEAPFANYTLNLGNLDIIPGIRYDNNNRFGDQTSPSLGAIYQFKDERETSIRFKATRAFQAPPLLWLFNDDPSFLVAPNPELKAEKAMVYEIGLETNPLSALNLNLNYSLAQIRDAIKIVFNEDSLFQSQNFDKFRRQSVDLTLDYTLSEEWHFFTSSAFNHVVDKATDEVVRGNGTARQSFRWGANYKNKKGFGLNLYGYYDRWDSDASDEPNDRKPIFDAKLTQNYQPRYKNIKGEIFVNIHNITNSKYWSDKTFPLPERYFEGGFSLKF